MNLKIFETQLQLKCNTTPLLFSALHFHQPDVKNNLHDYLSKWHATTISVIKNALSKISPELFS